MATYQVTKESAFKGFSKIGKVVMYHAASTLLTVGTVYATRYSFDFANIDLKNVHDLAVGGIYIAWNLVAVFLTNYVQVHKAESAIEDASVVVKGDVGAIVGGAVYGSSLVADEQPEPEAQA